jgi:hypothetical protein
MSPTAQCCNLSVRVLLCRHCDNRLFANDIAACENIKNTSALLGTNIGVKSTHCEIAYTIASYITE